MEKFEQFSSLGHQILPTGYRGWGHEGHCSGAGSPLSSEVQCIIGNGNMVPPAPPHTHTQPLSSGGRSVYVPYLMHNVSTHVIVSKLLKRITKLLRVSDSVCTCACVCVWNWGPWSISYRKSVVVSYEIKAKRRKPYLRIEGNVRCLMTKNNWQTNLTSDWLLGEVRRGILLGVKNPSHKMVKRITAP